MALSSPAHATGLLSLDRICLMFARNGLRRVGTYRSEASLR
jgi:hypothetical protein